MAKVAIKGATVDYRRSRRKEERRRRRRRRGWGRQWARICKIVIPTFNGRICPLAALYDSFRPIRNYI